jgi:SET domain
MLRAARGSHRLARPRQALARVQVIDACRKGNKARFINHSCEPNCETQKWVVKGELKIGFFATKAIPFGAEIQFDYNFERYGDRPTKCHCGAASCRGFIGGSGDTYRGAAVDDAGTAGEDMQPIMITSALPLAAGSACDARLRLLACTAAFAPLGCTLRRVECPTSGVLLP